jgi:hypothetical protein
MNRRRASLTKVAERWTTGAHIGFRTLGTSESGKTNVHQVLALDEYSTTLGVIRWFGRWRKYAFFPESDRVFEQTCLREIADFCEQETKARRK